MGVFTLRISDLRLLVPSLPSLLCLMCLGATLREGVADIEETQLPCHPGYGVRKATDDLLELDDNEGCNYLKGEVPYINDTCVKLLEQGPCAEGEWLVIDEDEDLIMCKRRECPEGKVMYDDHCHSVDDNTPCKDTFEIIINDHGEGKCDCPPGYLYHPDTERCYVPYTKGPCRPGFIIKMKVDDDGGIGRCERNPCPKEKMTPLDSRCIPRNSIFFAKCYTIGEQEPCKDGGFLLIEPSLAKPFCLAQQPNSIVPRIVKRAAPCQVSYTQSCVRECEGPQSYAFTGACARNYVYISNRGRPICFRGRCRRTSL